MCKVVQCIYLWLVSGIEVVGYDYWFVVMGDLIVNWQQLFVVDVDVKVKVDGMDIDYY